LVLTLKKQLRRGYLMNWFSSLSNQILMQFNDI